MRMKVKEKQIEGLKVVMVDRFTTPCTQRIQKLEITLGKHQISEDLCVVGMGNMDVVLGIQWIHYLGRYYRYFQKMELCFQHNDKEVILQGLSNGSPRVVIVKKDGQLHLDMRN